MGVSFEARFARKVVKWDIFYDFQTLWLELYMAKNQELWFLKVCSFYDIPWPQPGFDNYNGAASSAWAKFNLEPERK